MPSFRDGIKCRPLYRTDLVNSVLDSGFSEGFESNMSSRLVCSLDKAAPPKGRSIRLLGRQEIESGAPCQVRSYLGRIAVRSPTTRVEMETACHIPQLCSTRLLVGRDAQRSVPLSANIVCTLVLTLTDPDVV